MAIATHSLSIYAFRSATVLKDYDWSGIDEGPKAACMMQRKQITTAEGVPRNWSVTRRDIRLPSWQRMRPRGTTPPSTAKSTWVFEVNGRLSRPYLPSLFTSSPSDFSKRWLRTLRAIDAGKKSVCQSPDEVNTVLYAAMTAYSVCFDLWNPGARKTPGTFFEILLGSVMGMVLPSYERTKFIPIPGVGQNVSTDIVFSCPRTNRGLVIPAKITTRERIVQPFAHQRILDSVFREGHYRSVLMCVSELQRATNDINEICVPGTIKLFQKHLAPLAASIT